MNDILDELQRKAEAASCGPWFASDWQQDDGPNRTTIERREPENVAPRSWGIWPDGIAKRAVASTEDGENPLPDAAYIAAADPQTVLRLIAVVRAAKAVGYSNGFDAAYPDKLDRLRQSLCALESAGTREDGTR